MKLIVNIFPIKINQDVYFKKELTFLHIVGAIEKLFSLDALNREVREAESVIHYMLRTCQRLKFMAK